jgi:hypothetical protein
MSYSFNCAGTTKDEAKANVAIEFDKVVEQQPVHEQDRETHEKAVGAMIDLVRDPTDDECVLVNVSGSCWKKEGEDKLEIAALTVSVTFRPR